MKGLLSASMKAKTVRRILSMSDNSDTETLSTTVTISGHLLEEWDEEREEMGYSDRSSYIRQHVQAGRKEFAQLHPSDSEQSDTLQSQVLEVIPKESGVGSDNNAPTPDDVVEAIIEPLKDEITREIDQLESSGRIHFKASYGGYVRNE
ncbi:hypothetical protein [Halobaculum sp. D14]|jgi:Arc/MetJ-type ribon-helix-helix transcriptional regulator|uniref:hypothetical protein n=1 Tax=Halobaculum sp. D14 TaxID=3421642 RepID=UPI003EB9B886